MMNTQPIPTQEKPSKATDSEGDWG